LNVGYCVHNVLQNTFSANGIWVRLGFKGEVNSVIIEVQMQKHEWTQ